MIQLPLQNRSFFLFLVLTMALIIAGINNWYFYQDREQQAHYNHQTLLRTADAVWAECRARQSHPECLAGLIDIVKNSHWRGMISVLGSEGEVLVRYDTQPKQRDRSTVVSERRLGSAAESVQLRIEQFVTPSLGSSLFSSTTISVVDLATLLWSGASRQELWGFIQAVAWPRSRPFLFFLLAMFLLLYAARKGTQQYLEQVDALKSSMTSHQLEIGKVGKDKESLANQIAEMQNRINDFNADRQAIDTLVEETSEKEVASLTKVQELEESIVKARKEKSAIELRLAKTQERENTLKTQIEDLETRLVATERPSDPTEKSVKRNIERILLDNPDVGKGDLVGSNAGRHHGNDYISKLIQAISDSRMRVNVVKSIYSTAYQPRKRRTIQVCKLEKMNRYGLVISHEDDQGTAAELVLHGGEYWQAVIDAKYLRETVRMLKNHTIEF